jgi:hypothetical protein
MRRTFILTIAALFMLLQPAELIARSGGGSSSGGGHSSTGGKSSNSGSHQTGNGYVNPSYQHMPGYFRHNGTYV